ncbi:uncharacterized [Tachysurus ichikawai]
MQMEAQRLELQRSAAAGELRAKKSYPEWIPALYDEVATSGYQLSMTTGMEGVGTILVISIVPQDCPNSLHTCGLRKPEVW